MKVTIPLNSTLSTDSHNNDIKDPAADRDLFNKNQSYLFNGHLTNAKKKIIPAGDYITTCADQLSVITDGEKTQIYHDGTVIADVLSLGIENTSFLDRDDALIHEGFLWAVQRTLTGYILEQTDLQTQEVTITPVEQDGVLEVRFVRNTHKVITRNIDGTIAIDGVKYEDQEMAKYLSSFSGEFTAAEVNGKIYFGFNNPVGVPLETPGYILDLEIAKNINGWMLADKIPDQDTGYIININVADNVQIGAGENGFAMDLLTGVAHPTRHEINLNLGSGTIISGKGGNGGNAINGTVFDGGSGTTAINVGSNIKIKGEGNSVIQGGGGGGAAIYIYAALWVTFPRLGKILVASMEGRGGGGGGRGIPGGTAGITSGSGVNIVNGTGILRHEGLDIVCFHPGFGGYDLHHGQIGFYTKYVSNWDISVRHGKPGLGGNAIRLVSPAVCTVNGVTLRGGVVKV